MLALHHYRGECCPNGHYQPIAGDPNAEFAFRAVAKQCHICAAVSIESERVSKTPHPEALYFEVRKAGQEVT